MKVALLGYGKMGKMIEQILLERDQQVVAVIDNESDWQTKFADFQKAEVAIDFSMPTVAVSNMIRCFENHIPVVVGTTGWLDRLDEVRTLCEQHQGSLVYGSNFSVGANLFMQLNKLLADMMNEQTQYEALVEETHHTAKKDAPSGTAITLAKGLLERVGRYQEWQLTQESTQAPVLPVKAYRIGEVPGIHKISWKSEEDDIEIVHSAHSRKGFAAGAVRAALWLPTHPGIFEFQNIALQLTK
ncbi:MAG: 4-hydroxy-tetrahydrodipicolinate reductase [Bacteroidales bacterium]|nr:4-hydroxy-tetrahydrodipicolinate reductase [Bacteroidales bacterium]